MLYENLGRGLPQLIAFDITGVVNEVCRTSKAFESRDVLENALAISAIVNKHF